MAFPSASSTLRGNTANSTDTVCIKHNVASVEKTKEKICQRVSSINGTREMLIWHVLLTTSRGLLSKCLDRCKYMFVVDLGVMYVFCYSSFMGIFAVCSALSFC